MNVNEALNSCNLEEIIDGMNAYAISRLRTVGIKSFNGKEPIDFVGEVLLKVLENQRDFNNAKCSFKEFLFGCLRSEIYNFFVTNKKIITDEIPEISDNEVDTSLIAEQKKQISQLLEDEGADADELIVFDCWMDGSTKPSEIAKDLGISVKEVNNITRRLERKLPKIQLQATKIL